MSIVYSSFSWVLTRDSVNLRLSTKSMIDLLSQPLLYSPMKLSSLKKTTLNTFLCNFVLNLHLNHYFSFLAYWQLLHSNMHICPCFPKLLWLYNHDNNNYNNVNRITIFFAILIAYDVLFFKSMFFTFSSRPHSLSSGFSVHKFILRWFSINYQWKTQILTRGTN